jgi:hypothetical protein
MKTAVLVTEPFRAQQQRAILHLGDDLPAGKALAPETFD